MTGFNKKGPQNQGPTTGGGRGMGKDFNNTAGNGRGLGEGRQFQ